jgi:hypothetical protein
VKRPEPTTIVCLAAIAAMALILLARPDDAGQLRGAVGGGDWSEHLARVAAVEAWQSEVASAPAAFIAVTDTSYPPFLHYVMGVVGAVTGHGEVAVGRAMVLWLLLLSASVGICAWRITDEPRTGWLAAAGAALIPGVAASAIIYFYDLPMTALLWLSLALLLLLRRGMPEIAGVLAGVVWACACVTKWTALPFGAVMLAAGLLVHRPKETFNRGELFHRGRSLVAIAVSAGLLLWGWFSVSTVSWRTMSETSMSDPNAWTVDQGRGVLELLAGLGDKVAPFSWSRLFSYPVDLALGLFSPLLALALLALLVLWAVRDRRGALLVVVLCAGQWALLFFLVPRADPRFLMTLAPALVLASVFALGQLPPRWAAGLAIGWAVIALWVVWDVHHVRQGPLSGYWSATPHRQHGFISGRGVGLRSGDPGTAYVRLDETEVVFEPRREQLWQAAVGCEPEVLLYDTGVLIDSADDTWWRYRWKLARIRGEPAPQTVSPMGPHGPSGLRTLIVTLGAEPEGAWSRAGRLDRWTLWEAPAGSCRRTPVSESP